MLLVARVVLMTKVLLPLLLVPIFLDPLARGGWRWWKGSERRGGRLPLRLSQNITWGRIRLRLVAVLRRTGLVLMLVLKRTVLEPILVKRVPRKRLKMFWRA